MPQPPASQPAQFSTPNASKFRLPKRADERGATPLATPGGGPPSAVRPAPRFAPSWRRHSFLPQSQAQAQAHPQVPAPSGIYTPRPVSRHARQFSSVGRARNHTLQGAPALITEDSIEDGSSPPRADAGVLESAPEPINTITSNNDMANEIDNEIGNHIEFSSTDESLVVVRDSPTVVRTLAEHPRHIQHLQRRRRGRGPQEEIEDVPGSEDGREESGSVEVVKGTDLGVVEDSGEMPVPDSFDSNACLAAAAAAAATTPGLPREHTEQPKSVLPQQRSATRLLSSAQPFKKRRLFVPPGMITSSPGNDDENGGVDGDVGYDAGATTAERRQSTKKSKRRPWEIDIDDDDDDESDKEGDSLNGMEYEEIQDIVNYGELLEYGDSDDEMNDGNDRDRDGDEEHHENEEYDNEDDYSIFDRTPTRIRRARQEEREKAQSISKSRPAQPTFQRARLFMSARRLVEANANEGGGKNNENDDNADNNDLMQVDTTPSHNDKRLNTLSTIGTISTIKPIDYALPAPDFFSPQKKKKRNAKGKHKRQSINEEGNDGAAAAPTPNTAAPTEQYIPGGLAAELRDWLVQIKNGSGMAAAGSKAKEKTKTKSKPLRNILGAYQVDAMTEPSAGMRLALARQTTASSTSTSTSTAEAETLEAHLLLAGDDKSARVRHAGTRQGDRPIPSLLLSTVSVGAPAWEVVLDGQTWTVASNWSGGRSR